MQSFGESAMILTEPVEEFRMLNGCFGMREETDREAMRGRPLGVSANVGLARIPVLRAAGILFQAGPLDIHCHQYVDTIHEDPCLPILLLIVKGDQFYEVSRASAG